MAEMAQTTSINASNVLVEEIGNQRVIVKEGTGSLFSLGLRSRVEAHPDDVYTCVQMHTHRCLTPWIAAPAINHPHFAPGARSDLVTGRLTYVLCVLPM